MAKSLVVTGIKEIDAKIRKLQDPKRTNKIVRDALKRAMQPMLKQAKANCPVDTGAMRKSMKLVAVRSRKGPSYRIRISKATLQKAAPGVSSKSGAIYPASVEFGSEHQEPQAPMRNAFDSGKEDAKDKCILDIRSQIMAAIEKG